MKSFLKKWAYLLVTLICSLGVVIAIYVLQDVAPFGGNSLLTIDFFHQYGPMLAELRDRLLNGSNLIYSFRMGMGLPFFRNFFNYLSSPFNILLLIFKQKDILMSYSVIIGLKAVSSAVTMSLYLKNKLGKNYAFIGLALLYAFCAYFTAYYWNIMWLDGMVCLPLIALGIDRLVNKNKIIIYVISLAVMIFANYFIGYMLCIFSVLYFLVELFIQTKELDFKKILKKIASFSGASLIAGGLCALFLIPLFLGLKEISATSDVIPTSQYYAFSLKEFLFNHFTGVGSTVLKSGITCAPNISVGVLGIALLLLFIINPKINIKVKVSYLTFLIFMSICFRWALTDFVWHAFHVPNDLPYRYSFIYSFILIVISAYSIKNIKYIKPVLVGCAYIVSLIFITLMKVLEFENINNDMIIVNYIVITIYYLCYIMVVYFKNWKKWATCFMILTASLECIMVINNNWHIDQNIEGFYSDYNDTKKALDYVKNNDNDFYRLERLSMLTFNDPSWYGYNGQVTFSSMEYENMAVLQHALGMPGNEINSYYYMQNTPIYDLMFDIKYLIGYSVDEARYSKFYQGNETVYKFKNTAGLMFGVNQNAKKWKATYENAIKNQNDFIEKASGIDNILEKIQFDKKEIVFEDDNHLIVKYSLVNYGDNYYIYLSNSYPCDFIYTEGTLYNFNDDYKYVNDYNEFNIYNYRNYNENFIINKKSTGHFIEIYIGYSYYDDYVDNELEIYKLNIQKFDNVYNYFLNNKLDIIKFKESYIKANSNYNEDTLIYTSIPYDKGWNVYVDGKKIETDIVGNALLAFEVPRGNHNIELKYKIPYFNIGAIVSLISLGSLALWLKLKKN